MINLYLVRPLTGTDYVVSRWAAFLTVMIGGRVAAADHPASSVSAMGDPTPIDYLRDALARHPAIPRWPASRWRRTPRRWRCSPRRSRRGAPTRRCSSSGCSSSRRRSPSASPQEIGGTAGQWISMFNLTNIPVHVNDMIFGERARSPRTRPRARSPPGSASPGTSPGPSSPARVLWSRYRRLTP